MPSHRKLERAIVLAAGTGSRLVNGEQSPKPLKPVSGVPLLIRILRLLQDEGIREAVIVVGHQGEPIRRALLAEPSLALSLTFVQNDRFHLRNGVSLLAAREHVVEGTLLTMADHLYSPEIVRRLRAMELPRGASALAVDFDVERCFDIDDATKVRVEQGRIADIGKEIADYNAIDTGVFRIGPELVDELARLLDERGDCSLSDGVRALADKGAFHTCDAGDARWIDVDTPAALQRAEAMIRVFGDGLGDEPAAAPGGVDPEAVELFAPTWVRAVHPYREDHFELAERRDVDRMMSNESPFEPSKRVLDAIMAAARRGNLYPQGASELRRKLGRREGLDEQSVLLGAGSAELIDLAIRTFVAPGEEVVISVPTFSMYEARTRTVGGIPVLVSMTPDAEFDVGAMIGAVTERTKLMFLCTPNNPTGNRVQEAAIRRILRLGLPTVVDEAYHELGETPESLAFLLAEFPNAIFLRTFSKAMGLAGVRLGYTLAHPSVIKLLARVKVPWNVSGLALAAASAALDDVAEQEARMRLLREGRAYLLRELDRMPGISALRSEGNFVLIDVSRCGMSADAVVAAMLDRGVLVRSLAAHHAGRSMVRITVGNAEQNARCVSLMRQILAPQPKPAAEQDSL
ncbi:MAG: histidinol-phosphate transaminase [Polyangiaceae bacterium]|nr:histidinol-phosphate transaminase [Polyangiaceae bacterium]